MADSAVPPAAARVFGDRLPLAIAYANWLTGEGVRRGLVGPREVDRIWPRHLINCAVLAALIPSDARVVDLGSGAGLPGVPLMIARPDLQVVLVDSLLRRTTFLTEVVADLGLAGVTVRRARAEELARAELDADVVTARAVTAVARLCQLAGPLLASEGCLLAIKGDGVWDELAAGWRSIRSSGFAGDVDLLALGVDSGGPETWRNVSVDSLAHWSDAAVPAHLTATGTVSGKHPARAALVLQIHRGRRTTPQRHPPAGGVV